MLQQRHRIPTVFNIYMLDVICCALGCVVLLWQVSYQEADQQTAQAHESRREAEQQSAEAKKAQAAFEKARQEVFSASTKLTALDKEYLRLQESLKLTEKEREDARMLAALRQAEIDKARKALSLSKTEYKKLQDDLALLLATKKKTDAELTGQLRINAEMLVKLAVAEKQITTLNSDIADKQKTLTLNEVQYKKLQKDLGQMLASKKKVDADLTGNLKLNAELLVKLGLAEKQITALNSDISDKEKALSLSEKQYKKLQGDLTKLLAAKKGADAELTGQLKINAELLVKIALADKQIGSLKTDVAGKQTDLDAVLKKWQDQTALVKLSEENARKLQKLLDVLQSDQKDAQNKLKLTELQLKVRDQDLDRIRKELSLGTKDLTNAKGLIVTLTTERDALKDKLVTSDKAIDELKGDKTKLTERMKDMQAEVDQRFAGIPLSGENVMFMIDVSGSMIMKDANTEDPDKWPFLCDTLMRLMRSITSMKRFQIILFSDKTHYLFGNRDYWLKYEGPKTAKAAHDALKRFEVGGNTNMHDGFEEVFRYRKAGLDTIYLFSDGLPNAGAGMPANVLNPSEAQLNLHLGKYVRDKLKQTWNRPEPGKEAVRINAIGFYYDSPDVGAFLWAMTREHRGSFVGLR